MLDTKSLNSFVGSHSSHPKIDGFFEAMASALSGSASSRAFLKWWSQQFKKKKKEWLEKLMLFYFFSKKNDGLNFWFWNASLNFMMFDCLKIVDW